MFGSLLAEVSLNWFQICISFRFFAVFGNFPLFDRVKWIRLPMATRDILKGTRNRDAVADRNRARWYDWTEVLGVARSKSTEPGFNVAQDLALHFLTAIIGQ